MMSVAAPAANRNPCRINELCITHPFLNDKNEEYVGTDCIVSAFTPTGYFRTTRQAIDEPRFLRPIFPQQPLFDAVGVVEIVEREVAEHDVDASSGSILRAATAIAHWSRRELFEPFDHRRPFAVEAIHFGVEIELSRASSGSSREGSYDLIGCEGRGASVRAAEMHDRLHGRQMDGMLVRRPNRPAPAAAFATRAALRKSIAARAPRPAGQLIETIVGFVR